MKRLLTLLFFLFVTVCAYCQQWEDVVYLKNGSIIHGNVIEQVPGESLKIQTSDGSVFVYKMAEVEKITKEQIQKTVSKEEEAKKTLKYDTSSLKIETGKVINDYGTVFTKGQLYEYWERNQQMRYMITLNNKRNLL